MGSEALVANGKEKGQKVENGTGKVQIIENGQAIQLVENGKEKGQKVENGTEKPEMIENGQAIQLVANGKEKGQKVENGIEKEQMIGSGQAIQNGTMHELIVEKSIENGHTIENGLVNVHGDSFSVRQLEISDHKKGFVELLGQLSPTGPLSEEEFQAHFAELALMGPDHHICVIEDLTSCRIVATGSVFIERKFIRGCSNAGHIEDVVVDKGARGLHLGQRVVKHLIDHAKAQGCYKVVLNCKPELREFYQKCGFAEKNVQMAIYF